MQNAELKLKKESQKGFTLVELMIVAAISAVMFGLVAFNMLRLQNNTSSGSNVDTLVSDLKSQQIKALVGATEGRATNDNYGIYFLSDQYVLFHGSSYSASDSTNFPVKLASDVQVKATTFPSNTVIFTKLSGEISGFVPGNNTITLKEINSNRQTTITINRYGVITSVN